MKILRLFRTHILVLLAGAVCFRSSMADFLYFLIWWLSLVALGVIFLPLTDLAFGRFRHRGYMFAKPIGLALAGYPQWVLSSFRIVPFRTWSCFLIVALFLILNLGINQKTKTWQKFMSDESLLKSITNQEALFMGLLLFWTFLRALRPEIEGLEKYMDFGFVNSILRSDWFPAPDMWLAGENINYYYLGHYFAAFMTKLTFIHPAVAYNLMMATLFALPFMLAYSVAEFFIELYQKNSAKEVPARAGVWAGILAGLAICVGGNLHTVIFGVLFPHWHISDSYSFTNATRYIGFNPDWENDKTIHEFPQYSYIVSDLHAHVINMLFVLTVVGLAIVLAVDILNAYRKPDHAPALFKKPNALKWLNISFFLIILLIGLFPAVNFWDYFIYVVVTGAMCLYANLRAHDYTMKSLYMTIGQAAAIAIGAYIVTLPFHLSFDSMGTQVKLAAHHSMIRQLGVLWGYQLFFAVILIWIMLQRYKRMDAARHTASKKKSKKARASAAAHGLIPGGGHALCIPEAEKKQKHPLFGFIEKANPADALVFVIFICAIGLVIIPELIYVVDIYPTYPRANTMFKLGYQAFILFGLGVSYTMVRMTFETIESFKWKKIAACAGAILIAAALIYPFYGIGQWYGSLSPSGVKGLDGTKYMLTQEKWYTGANDEATFVKLEDDYELIQYINQNIKGSPVIAEAFGDSYTLNGRISANTGLPNILNWYYHQYLWRNSNGPMLDERRNDINDLYMSGSADRVREIIGKYGVQYIAVGQIERLRYPGMDENLLRSMGNIVFQSNDLYMIQTSAI